MRSVPSKTSRKSGLQRRLCALGAGLRAALRALRADTGPHPTKR